MLRRHQLPQGGRCLLFAKGEKNDTRPQIREFVQKNEMRFKDEFDAWSFLSTFERNIGDCLLKESDTSLKLVLE